MPNSMTSLAEPAGTGEARLDGDARLDTTEDALLGGALRFFQPRRGYRVAIDPVLLAAAVAAAPGETVLDAGTGSGAAALCLLRRMPACRVTGLERDPDLVALARTNAAANGMTERFCVCRGDLLARPGPLRPGTFDHVMTNPPYHPGHAATAPETSTKRSAHLADADLADWVAACLRYLRPNGRLTLIHRADRLDWIVAALAGRAGDMTLCPLWPTAAAAAAKRIIVAARKSSRGPARLFRGLVLHEADGRFTPQAEAVLRHGAAISMLA